MRGLHMIRTTAVAPPDFGVPGIDMSSDWHGRPLVVLDDDGDFLGITGSHRLQGSVDAQLYSVPAIIIPWKPVKRTVWDQFGFKLEPHELPLDDYGLGLIADAVRVCGYPEAADVLLDESAICPTRYYIVIYSREGDRAWLKIDGVPHEAAMHGDVMGAVFSVGR